MNKIIAIVGLCSALVAPTTLVQDPNNAADQDPNVPKSVVQDPKKPGDDGKALAPQDSLFSLPGKSSGARPALPHDSKDDFGSHTIGVPAYVLRPCCNPPR